jgi:hypothetical protein
VIRDIPRQITEILLVIIRVTWCERTQPAWREQLIMHDIDNVLLAVRVKGQGAAAKWRISD